MGRARTVLAAVDLGSNSFHMIVARQADGQLVVIDRLREMVRLGEGLGPDGRLDPKVSARALACRERFGQRLLHMRANCVRAVGTSALRRARHNEAFLEKARRALGHPIEVISGREEARLIYSGVVRTLPRIAGRRLVVDIGGGSTELIIGQGTRPLELESLKLGCVTVSTDYFADGRLTPGRFERARLAARQELEPIRRTFRKRGWEDVAGSSGTVRAQFEALRELDPHRGTITLGGLEELVDAFVMAGHVSRLPFHSLGPDRRPVIAGGLAILVEVLSELGIKRMHVAEGAMREGVLHDLVGRLKFEDAREQTVRSMQARYPVDLAQAARVERTALSLLRQVREGWQLREPIAQHMLSWAARLYEVGDAARAPQCSFRRHRRGAARRHRATQQAHPPRPAPRSQGLCRAPEGGRTGDARGLGVMARHRRRARRRLLARDYRACSSQCCTVRRFDQCGRRPSHGSQSIWRARGNSSWLSGSSNAASAASKFGRGSSALPGRCLPRSAA